MTSTNEQPETETKPEAGSSIPELSKEHEYPAQGAYVGYLITDFLYSRLTSTVTDVVYENDCVTWFLDMHLHEEANVVDVLPLAVTFHRGTISLLCDEEEWWPTLEQSILYKRLYAIAEYAGCLVALSAVKTNAGSVKDPEVVNQTEGKNIMEQHDTVQ